MNHRKIIIAIDGHSSCGKSTLSKQLAQRLKYKYIDTGAMYRAVTLYALRKGLIENQTINETELLKQLSNIKITFSYNDEEQKSDTILNNENIESEIRELNVSNNVSPVATIKEVRECMVKQQQAMGKDKGIVMDGRDIGTVVFPEAELKIFMTASSKIRAQRRYDELQHKGSNVTFSEILKNVEERDFIDSNREESPLKQAKDSILLDNSNISREEQLNWVTDKITEVLNAH